MANLSAGVLVSPRDVEGNIWVPRLRRSFAHAIRINSSLFSAYQSDMEYFHKWVEEIESRLRHEQKIAEMIQAAYEMPEGSSARQWAEMMLQAFESEG